MSENTAFYSPALEGAALSGEGFNQAPLNDSGTRVGQLSDETLVARLYAIACEPDHEAERDTLAAIITDRLIETYGCDEVLGPRLQHRGLIVSEESSGWPTGPGTRWPPAAPSAT